jgi:histidine decarboxylase
MENFLSLNKSTKQDILNKFEEYIKDRTKFHLGYPYNLDFEYEELSRFFKYSINNLGDPFNASNYGVHSRQFELEILEFFSKLWKLDDYWGYVTNSGTEGNLQSILIARENFPDGILYSSDESHYSIFKAAHLYRMEAKTIPTSWDGCMRLDLLRSEISKNKDKPVIININIGTTVKGAVDNIDGILGVLKQLNIPRERYYIHCDGALFAMMLPFLESANSVTVDFTMNIDSIAISGHKFLGCPMPCGVMLTRKHLMTSLLKPIEYLNSVDSTITGSRNGLSSLFIWNVIANKGYEGFKKDVKNTMTNAKYLEKELQKRGISSFRNSLSSTIIFERPNEEFVLKWQLACTGNIAHVVVMPSVDKIKIDLFLQEIDQITFKKICIKNYMDVYCQCNDCK